MIVWRITTQQQSFYGPLCLEDKMEDYQNCAKEEYGSFIHVYVYVRMYMQARVHMKNVICLSLSYIFIYY